MMHTSEKKYKEHKNFFLTHVNYSFRMPLIGILKTIAVINKNKLLTSDLLELINNIEDSAYELLNNIDRVGNAVIAEVMSINSAKIAMGEES